MKILILLWIRHWQPEYELTAVINQIMVALCYHNLSFIQSVSCVRISYQAFLVEENGGGHIWSFANFLSI